MYSYLNGTYFFDLDLGFDRAVSHYKKRRQAVLNSLTSPWLIVGPQKKLDALYSWLNVKQVFFQDPMLVYLTGLNQVNTAIILDPETNTVRVFLPKNDQELVRWEGGFLGVNTENYKALKAAFMWDEIDCIDNIGAFLQSYSKKQLAFSTASMTKQETSAVLYQKSKIEVELSSSIELIETKSIEYDHRLLIDPEALSCVKKAVLLSQQVFQHVVKTLKHAKSEADLYGALIGEIWKSSCFGPSFPAIVASGKQALCLHYTQNNQDLEPGGLVLIDFGIRWQSYVSDITRTLPVDSNTHPIDALVYQLVLDTQAYVERLVKPGVSLEILNTACWAYLNALLDKYILQKGGLVRTDYDQMPHQVGHFIGIAVHDGDAHRHYKTKPLKEGQIITNEPGFYGKVSMKLNNKTETRTVGIRIEDMLLLTKSGCSNLTTCLDKWQPTIEE